MRQGTGTIDQFRRVASDECNVMASPYLSGISHGANKGYVVNEENHLRGKD